MDAVKVGARVYHASCHAEASKDGGGTPMRAVTPDSILGKRKAEVWHVKRIRIRLADTTQQNELDALRARIKKEPTAP